MIKKINLYIGLSFILGLLFPFTWLLTLGLLNELKNEKGINIPFLKINIIIFISAFFYGILPILLTLIQILFLNPGKINPTHILCYYTILQAFIAYIVSFCGYNLYVWKKLSR